MKEKALARSLRIQSRVVGALLMREVLTRYGRHNIGFLWLFLEPMLFTLGVTALWSLAGLHREAPIPIVAFAVTGYSSVLLWRNMPNRCVTAIEPNLALMYHRNVRLMDVFAARLVLEAAGATVSFAVLAATFTFLGWMLPPINILQVILGWLMLTWFGASLALLLGCLAGRSELVEKFWHPASYLMFPLSGAAFMVEWLPPAAQKAIFWLPMVHGVEYIRDGYFGQAVRTHYDLAYMAVSCLLLSALGLAQERLISREVTPE